MDASYYIAPHVHLCVAGTQVVFLDLERDGYYAVSQGHPAGRWVKGWPQPPSAATSPADEKDRSASSGSGLLAKMKSQGMLVTDSALGKEATPLITNEPRTALVEHDLNVRPHAKCGQLGRMIGAYLTARWMLKHRPIKDVVGSIARLRAKRRASPSDPDITRLRSLVTVFSYLRPLLYTAHDACLLDSLTLLHFMAGYGLYPRWIFAVRTNPFLAHCWVQQDDLVFNDQLDYIRRFSPILVV
jgi:hypothetical protein